MVLPDDHIMSLNFHQALRYILNTTGYNFPKRRQKIASIRLLAGKGIVWAQGRRFIIVHYSVCSLFIFFFRRTTCAAQEGHESLLFFWRPQNISSFVPVHGTESTVTPYR